MLTDTDVIRPAEASAEFLDFEIADDALERAAVIIGGQATPVTLVYGTSVVGNCACPCSKAQSWSALLDARSRVA